MNVIIEAIAGSTGDLESAPAVVALKESFLRLQTVTSQATWFNGTILKNLSKDWSWR